MATDPTNRPSLVLLGSEKSKSRVFFARKPLTHHAQICTDTSDVTATTIANNNTVISRDEEIKPSQEPLYIGLRFNSFSEFEELFERWKAENCHPFRVASSETLRLPDGSVDPVFKYRYIVYHCAHYGTPRIRGSGKRRNQTYLPCGCQAMLRLNYSWSENALRLTTLCSVHSGHETSPEAYEQFTGKRLVRAMASNGVWRNSPCLADTASESSDTPPPVLRSAKQESEYPMDISTLETGMDSVDQRSDEDRFEMIHVVLQGLSDHLLRLQGAPFDARLTELQVMLTKWQGRSGPLVKAKRPHSKATPERRNSTALQG